ncbi:MAG TPA: alpha/beta hydrolase-fold protein [Candidatus Aminicenantes bacterium]|nr:alpha/beta hydrolase-fold protein [Candidatus Aminicenantes bacterium]HRY64929.1 alpha/beta hydrolase-fold protein [Candidatus Aminicenantes bacterium]HRZ71842.1 alpha/beta hydrolase-fold protein [Candidatus Aminicenantes bacterium]
MKPSRIPAVLLLAAILTAPALAPRLGLAADAAPAQVLEGLKLSSAVLGRDVAYAVYLPPGYESSTQRFPVVYLLHGYTDNESGWIQFGEVQLAADRAIADREIPPMIIVMPDGGVTFYINDAAGRVRYEDMFTQELIPFIDRTYRTRPDRRFRGVAGLSMGGWGTLVYALRHPDLFSAGAAFSAAVWSDEDILGMKQKNWDDLLGPLFGAVGKAGRDRLTARFRETSPLDLARSLPEDSLKQVRYYIDCGDDDFLIGGNCALHLLLTDRKIPHEFRVRDGGHAWAYWRSGIVEGLKFIGQGFRR